MRGLGWWRSPAGPDVAERLERAAIQLEEATLDLRRRLSQVQRESKEKDQHE